MGDIHGNYKGLLECLEKSKFNKKEDVLIQLGDVADGWSEVYECVEELLSIDNLISIKGNHDDWFYDYICSGIHGSNWSQGAKATYLSYLKNCDKQEDLNYLNDTGLNIPETHQKFFRNQIDYYIDSDNRCFVHGGFNRHLHIKEQNIPYIYYWDRDLWHTALSFKAMSKNLSLDKHYAKFKIKDNFSEIFIGHTATINWNTTEPMQAANIWNIDTGSGFKGKLTIMDVETKEYWQSNFANQLYPDEIGR